MEEFKNYIKNKYKFSDEEFNYLYKIFKDNGINLIFKSIIRAKSVMSDDFVKINEIMCDGYKITFDVDDEKIIKLNILFFDDKSFDFEFKEFILFCCDFIKSYYKFKNRIKEIEVNANLFDRREYTKTDYWNNIYYNKFEIVENNPLEYEIPLDACLEIGFAIDLDNLNL